MRELKSHGPSGPNVCLRIQVLDEPGLGNANHEYRILYSHRTPHGPCVSKIPIKFHNGPIAVNQENINGISNEALLAIVEDRLLGLQSGEFSCRENAIALTKIQEALLWLHKRTRDRAEAWR